MLLVYNSWIGKRQEIMCLTVVACSVLVFVQFKLPDHSAIFKSEMRFSWINTCAQKLWAMPFVRHWIVVVVLSKEVQHHAVLIEDHELLQILLKFRNLIFHKLISHTTKKTSNVWHLWLFLFCLRCLWLIIVFISIVLSNVIFNLVANFFGIVEIYVAHSLSSE